MSRTFRMVATAARRPRTKVDDGHDRTAAAAPDGTASTMATVATRTRRLTVSDRIRWGRERETAGAQWWAPVMRRSLSRIAIAVRPADVGCSLSRIAIARAPCPGPLLVVRSGSRGWAGDHAEHSP